MAKAKLSIQGYRKPPDGTYQFEVTVDAPDNFNDTGDLNKINHAFKQLVLNQYPSIYTDRNIVDFKVIGGRIIKETNKEKSSSSSGSGNSFSSRSSSGSSGTGVFRRPLIWIPFRIVWWIISKIFSFIWKEIKGVLD